MIGEVRFANPPLIINGIAIVGSTVRDNHRYNAPSGAIRAFDARTGAPRWSFDPIPRDARTAERLGWTDAAATFTTFVDNCFLLLIATEARLAAGSSEKIPCLTR